ncbi:hypothetical protein F8M41_017501 [Gigaspora margarita]|uniref:Uncharacterized protein n=1 Tax=Gigaspora margarita TaxID=4874 RepID=A0A8H4EM22_GIGMA|nr:hypothetical protein F8M41_017501 [Gigaspora margarita]
MELAHDESVSNFNNIDLEFDEPAHDDFESARLTYDSLVSTSENRDLDLGSLKEELREGMKFQSWDEAYDRIEIYTQQEGFGLRKGHSTKTSERVI